MAKKCTKCKEELPDEALYCPYCGKKQDSEKRKTLKRANGTGTVYKLQGRRRKPWVAAKSKTIIGYYEKKSEAVEALERLSGKSLNERYNMTFEDVFKEWSKEHYRNVGRQAVDSYNAAFKIYEPIYGEKFRSLHTQDFQAIIDRNIHKSHSTLQLYKNLITQMSKWAMREEIITTNFAQFVQLPKQQAKKKEIFSEADIKLLESDNSETAMIILMLIYTGMRIGELFNLPKADCHGNYVVGGEKTNAGKNRIIPIRPEGRKYFEYFSRQATGPLLLSGYTGNKNPNNFRGKDYYPLLEKLGIERKTPHSTRHTFATWAVSKEMQPEILKSILGHANYSTTAEIYFHTNINQLIEAVEK